MKSILFPTDFSPLADNALIFAGAMAHAMGASIELLHTYRVPLDYPIPASMLDEMDKDEHLMVEKILQNTISKYYEQHPEHKDSVKMTATAIQGFTADVIVENAEAHNHDIIIMGTKGASGLTEILLGSMASSIIDSAKCPVMAIPEKAVFEGIHHLVYASDFSAKDYDSIHQLAAFAKFFDAQTHCIHVSNDEDYFIDDVSFDLMEDQYKQYFPSDKVDFKVLLGKGLEDGLAESITGHKADVIAMTTRKRSFLDKLFSRSHTKKMAFHSNVPLLAFHE